MTRYAQHARECRRSKPSSQAFPDSPAATEQDALNKPPIRSRCEPHLEFIESTIAGGRYGKAISQELVDDHGFGGHYESVTRFIGRARPATRVAHPRIATETGEEGKSTTPWKSTKASGLQRQTSPYPPHTDGIRAMNHQASTRSVVAPSRASEGLQA